MRGQHGSGTKEEWWVHDVIKDDLASVSFGNSATTTRLREGRGMHCVLEFALIFCRMFEASHEANRVG